MDNIGGRRKVSPAGRAMNVVGQCLSLDIVHDHISDCCPGFWRTKSLKVMNLHDVRMVQRGYDPRFTNETFHEIRIILQVIVEEFDGNIALQLGVEGLPDFGDDTLS